MYKVTLDPGHDQFSNISPVNPKYVEGVQMWKLATYLKSALEKYGIEVVLTRPRLEDKIPEVYDRGKIAANNDSDLMISLHSNAPFSVDGTFDQTITGTSVYYSLTDADNKDLADKLGAAISKTMGHMYRGSLTRAYGDGHPNWDYYEVSRGAARNGCTAAFLIEHGFHTCPKDIKFLLYDNYLETLAAAEAKVIAEYFGVKAKQQLYRVQIGSFTNRKYAETYKTKVAADGYQAFVFKVGKYYRVQIGSFSNYTNAEHYADKARTDGYQAFIVEV